jgi:heptose I phosphotransferase
LSLIDLHRAQVRPKTPRRWRDKDLSALYFSALGIGMTQRDFLRFLRVYFDCPLRDVLRDEAGLLEHLNREAAHLQRRFVRKFAKGATHE